MITQARIILPHLDNEGDAFPPQAIPMIERMLLHNWGGYTWHCGNGVWRDPSTGKVHSEVVNIYDIGADWYSPDQVDLLREVAAHAAKSLSQFCIFIYTPLAGVEFIQRKAEVRSAQIAAA